MIESVKRTDVYFHRLVTKGDTETRKMMLLKKATKGIPMRRVDTTLIASLTAILVIAATLDLGARERADKSRLKVRNKTSSSDCSLQPDRGPFRAAAAVGWRQLGSGPLRSVPNHRRTMRRRPRGRVLCLGPLPLFGSGRRHDR